MAGPFGNIGDRISTVFQNMNLSQKATVILVVAAALGAVAGIVHWASAPDFVPLFSNLPADDAGKIVDWLNENNIEYKLEQDGSRILVPRAEQYDARIQLAQEGLPGKRNTGYEIFDKTNLGMSEFVQKLNYRRALEGELSRTVESLDEVEEARVHIVIPEPALFREKEKPTTASVALKLRRQITEAQVQGVAYLVSSAVEGLESSQITIIDGRGNVLSNMSDRNPLLSMTATQMSLKRQVEEDMTRKVESMLNRLLGPDKAIVRVAVELDFTRSEQLSEIYDPEQTAIRSEEIIESTQTNQDQNQINPVDPTQPPLGSTDQTSETNNIINYEVSKTTTQRTRETGGIDRISASVAIDGVYEMVQGADGNQTQQYRDRTDREMQMITEAVRGALGFDQGRGDQINVINMPFETPRLPEEAPSAWEWLRDNWMTLLRNVLLGGAIIGLLFWVRNLLQRGSQAAREAWEGRLAAMPGGRQAQLPGAVSGEEERLSLPDIDSELPPEVVEANQLQEQLIDFVQEKPEIAARLLKTWLVDVE